MNDILTIIIKDLGYTSLYPTQEAAIKEGLLEGVNMLISTPTASGKTLIALLAAANHVNNGKKAVYITPLKALANEKYEEFKILEKYNKKVMISTSDLGSKSEFLNGADVIILTNEKLDSLMRYKSEWLKDVGVFIVDEIHLIGDRHRGATLEMILSKILTYYSNAQLLGLSATLKNAAEIADWLGCKLIKSDWRPVKLIEGVYSQGEIIYNDGRRVRIEQSNRGASIDLALDCIKNGGQALIFTETRRQAVSLAMKASDVMNRFINEDDRTKARSIARIIKESDDTELASNLAYVVSNCVAFHHAGLNYTCRKIVEDCYRAGLIKLITSTPTLAAGVNLPARRVIINSIKRFDIENGVEELSVMEYKQMCGRAGRPKYDEFGEAIIVSNDPQFIFDVYINGEPEEVRSSLLNDENIKMHLLGIIASFPGINEGRLFDIFSNTLMARYYRKSTIDNKLRSMLEYLLINELISLKDSNRFIPTKIGRLAALIYLHPETAIYFKDSLRDDLSTIELLNIVTQSYDFTPKLPLRNKDYDILDFIELNYEYNRSFLALYSWIEEHSEKFILEKWGVEPGDLYRMIESADWLLYGLQEFAKSMNKIDLMRRIDVLRRRVKYGVKEELLELVNIKDIGRVRARILYNAGYKSVKDIIDAPISKLASLPKIGDSLAKRIKSNLEK